VRRHPAEPVAILAVGIKAPGGLTVDDLWTSLCQGRSVAERFEDDRLPAGADLLVSRVGGFDPCDYLSAVQARRLDRSVQLAVAAAQDALDGVTGPRPPPERCAVVAGVGFGAGATYEDQHARLQRDGVRGLHPLTLPMIMPGAAAAQLSLRFGFTGPSMTVSAACASGALAIGEGVELLRRGSADLVLAGGLDSMVSYGTLCTFLKLEVMSRNVARPDLASRPFDVARDGFVMGEGAAFVVLQRAADARRANRPALASIVGYATSSDAHHLVAPHPDGDGALRCMRLALADAGVADREVAHVNAHGTSTLAGDLAEARALDRLFGGTTPPVTAVKGSTGHLIGGSGALEAVVTAWSLRTGLVPPVAGLRVVAPEVKADVVLGEPRAVPAGPALSNSFGFGGTNACLVLAPAAPG